MLRFYSSALSSTRFMTEVVIYWPLLSGATVLAAGLNVAYVCSIGELCNLQERNLRKLPSNLVNHII